MRWPDGPAGLSDREAIPRIDQEQSLTRRSSNTGILPLGDPSADSSSDALTHSGSASSTPGKIPVGAAGAAVQTAAAAIPGYLEQTYW